jgi:hypothetical protein
MIDLCRERMLHSTEHMRLLPVVIGLQCAVSHHMFSFSEHGDEVEASCCPL